MKTSKRNILHIELLRILAVFFVIFNHTGVKGFRLYINQDVGSFRYWIYLFISIGCKFSVFVFFMVSGVLLLSKDVDYKKLFKKILRMLIVIILFSAVYRIYICGGLQNLYKFGFNYFIGCVWRGEMMSAYWYLYAYISFLFSWPFLRAMVKIMKPKDYQYMIILQIVFTSILPVLEYLYPYYGNLNFGIRISWLFTNIIFWPLLGYYLEYVVKIENVKTYKVFFINVIGILGTIIGAILTYHLQITTGDINSEKFHSTFVLFPCIALYLTTKYLFVKWKALGYFKQSIKIMGSLTFGIYLIHILVMDSPLIKNFWDTILYAWGFNYMLTCFVICLLVMILSGIIIYLLKLIPFMQKLI